MLRKNLFRKARLPLKSIILVGILPSCIKKQIYRLKGYKIGKNVIFSFGSIIKAKESCIIGDNTRFGMFNIIIGNKIVIGKHCSIRSLTYLACHDIIIGDEVIISENVVIRAGHPSPQSKIIIKNKVHIFPYALIDPSYPIYIDEEACVGFYCDIYTHGAYKNILDGYKVVYSGVNIGKRVELTYKVFISPGVTIGDDTQIAYGSYVNKDIPSGVLAAGTPATVKRTKEQFAPTPDYVEKNNICKRIINDFVEYLKFYFNIAYKIKGNCWKLHYNKEFARIIFLNNEEKVQKEISKNDIFVILDQSVEKQRIINTRAQWFNLLTLECSGGKNPLGDELKRFFSRYGLRFIKP